MLSEDHIRKYHGQDRNGDHSHQILRKGGLVQKFKALKQTQPLVQLIKGGAL